MVRIFRQYIPIPFLILGLVEFLLLVSSVYAGTKLWTLLGYSEITPMEVLPVWARALVFALVVLLAQMSMGLYQRRLRFGLAGMILRIGISLAVTAVALTLLYYIVPGLLLGRGVLAFSFLTAALLLVFTRFLFVRSMNQDQLKRRVLVLGAGENAAQISRQLRRRVDQQGFVIVGHVHVRGEHDVVDESLVIRPDVTLLTLTKELNVDEIVVAVGERRRKSFPVHDLLDCKLSGINVIDLLGFFERETGKLKLDILNPSWMIFSDGFNQSKSLNAQKRIFDIIVSLLLLGIAWPFMLLVAIAIKMEGWGRGSIFYRQIRVGQHWQLFNVYKFRSMREDAEEGGKAQWAKQNDDRVTRVGKFIRKTRLDELPQIFNVLKGNMSFVGPRPERPEFVTQLSEQIPYFAERHRVKPGITGWAQICYPYGASEKDSLEKLQFDLYYIKNYSLFLDLVIILQTAHSVIAGKGGR
ncbi:MAG TPA: TIGR03013 family PEP-CTERM/XrtA system glycosyltransferase [Gammaproteobacteria bacterium]|nr:TIGR03013 family PEP-CTERM/XrtA system glycosyltransferase [Gammaproteobacteria bacterium]